MTESNLSAADVAAVTGNNNDMFGGGNGAWWIIILFLFVFCGWGGRGGWGGNGSGAMDNYVLTSDFSQLSRQMDSGFASQERRTDSIINGICDLGYTQLSLNNQLGMNMMQGFNTTQAQLADCCCKTQSGIERINTGMAMNTAALSRDVERGFCDTNYNNQTQHFQTMNAIDKVGDRIIDWMSQRDSQALRDENQALRLAASQAAQNQYLVNQLRPCPQPAYITCNPWASSAPYGSCGTCGGYA